jgi:hypothetical protein
VNEALYTSASTDAVKMMEEDPKVFDEVLVFLEFLSRSH